MYMGVDRKPKNMKNTFKKKQPGMTDAGHPVHSFSQVPSTSMHSFSLQENRQIVEEMQLIYSS